MKKILLTLVFTLLPPLFIVATTPLSSLNEHISHIALFAVLGIFMAGFSFQTEIKNMRFSLFSMLLFTVLFSFITVHAMPCQHMFSPNAQSSIDHPCSQPATPSMPILSFVLVTFYTLPLVLSSQKLLFSALVQTTDSRAPPLA